MTELGDKAKELDTKNAIVSLRADGIVVVRMKPGARETLEDARRLVELSTQLVGTPAYACLVDVRAPFSMDPGVRDIYARRSETVALALLIESGFGRVAGNLFLTLSAPSFPTRLFTSEHEAIAWLRRIAKAP